MIGSIHMGWRHVCFANWPVDPEIVEPHVPDALTLDTFEGSAWLSIVPFTNVDVRPTWVPEGWGFGLPEINLRTYVIHGGEPGVYFFNLDADGLLGILSARAFHYLPYYFARIEMDVDGETIHYSSDRFHPGARAARFEGSYRPVGGRFEAETGSLEKFLVERYRYYTESPRGAIRYAAVDHEPWPLYEVRVDIETNTYFEANWFDRPDTEPVYRYSPGVDTVASPSRRP